jgi:AcrR family transcriptional regulator
MVRAGMTATPWGEAEQLRSRKLTPGPGKGHEAVVRSQRERLFAATVAVVAAKGYQATRVEDILVMAGVSRNAFYRHFSNKRACFLATLEGIARFATPTILDVFEQTPGSWDRKLGAVLDALATAIVAQPAMARVAWVEVYAAGPDAVDVVEGIDRAIEDVLCRALRDSPERARMPRDVVRSIVGGVRNIIHTRVREERVDELPTLMPEFFAWMQVYHAPPERLRRPRRVPPELTAPQPEPHDPRERIVRAVTDLVADKGYPEMAITEIAARASVSLTTFYTHFDGKEAAFLAALADAQQQVFEATIGHFASASDWPSAVGIGARAFLGFLATHRAIALLGGVGVWATSPAGLDLRAQGMALFSALLDEGFRQYPDTGPMAAEAISASLDALLFKSLRYGGAGRLYEIGPTATFIALAPFVGTERACELANDAPVEVS